VHEVFDAEEGFVLDGSLDRDSVEERCRIALPEGEFETIAGFALILFGHIPAEHEQILWDGWELTVLSMDRQRIAKIRLRRLVKEEYIA
jgi:CBS domain containing-hemolysin-like protein